MIKFFRKIRQNLLAEGRTGKYIKYAIGEIILVVIGILIALQINNWNKANQLEITEKRYLTEIRNNLVIDQEQARAKIHFNNRKMAAIDTIMNLLKDAEEPEDYMEYLANYQPLLSSFPTFEPVKTAFQNMISSHSIDIIQNDDLRTQLSTYYNYNWERSPQSASRERTRKFANILSEKIIDYAPYHKNIKQQLKPMLNEENKFSWTDDFKLDIQDENHLEFHEDRAAISAMFVMLPTGVYHSAWIQGAEGDIENLLDMIDDELENK